jgi:hypothetical protein
MLRRRAEKSSPRRGTVTSTNRRRLRFDFCESSGGAMTTPNIYVLRNSALGVHVAYSTRHRRQHCRPTIQRFRANSVVQGGGFADRRYGIWPARHSDTSQDGRCRFHVVHARRAGDQSRSFARESNCDLRRHNDEASTTKSASSSDAPTGCATTNISATRCSPACCRRYDPPKPPTRFPEDPF